MTERSSSDYSGDELFASANPSGAAPAGSADRTTTFDPDATTSVFGRDADDAWNEEKPKATLHAGYDLGLLVLRLGLGGTMLAHGLQKVFGLFNGPGIGGFAQALTGYGYHGPTTVLSWVTGITELAGGALLILGLLTWVAASGILGVTASIVYVKYSGGFFNSGQGMGFEYELMLAVAAFALLYCGSGRLALDNGRRWHRHAPAFGTVGLLVAAAAVVVVNVLYHSPR